MKNAMRTRLLPVLILVATGCASDGGVTGTNGGSGSISVSLGGSTISIAQGANGTVDITVTRAGGFTGAVTLTVNGAPSGVTATVQPSALSAGVTAALLDFVIGAAVAPGTHTLTVRASGQGVSDATATLTLTITPTAQPDFALTLSSGALQFAQGAQGMVTVDIQRINGFAGAVALTATGLPNGLTVAFNPASVSGAS
ncbi:MAG TPA: hypothetical protein VMN78_11325, partial [Longimicrobiales bacterium]|nr:hypothetical protein [Longimicrobiales bacterium]